MSPPLTLDNRSGSIDLCEPLCKRGIPVRIGRLEFGDVSFVGNGPEGRPVLVGVEVKRIGDILRCFVDKRFAGHQLPGLVRTYEYPFLLIQGEASPCDRTGLVKVLVCKDDGSRFTAVHPARTMWSDMQKALLTYELQAGVRVLRAQGPTESAFMLAALYGWWTGKEWEEHRSHLAFNAAGPEGLLARHSLLRRWAKELPGIGYEKSKAIANNFMSALDMAQARPEDWEGIPGVGKELALRAYSAIREVKKR